MLHVARCTFAAMTVLSLLLLFHERRRSEVHSSSFLAVLQGTAGLSVYSSTRNLSQERTAMPRRLQFCRHRLKKKADLGQVYEVEICFCPQPLTEATPPSDGSERALPLFAVAQNFESIKGRERDTRSSPCPKS